MTSAIKYIVEKNLIDPSDCLHKHSKLNFYKYFNEVGCIYNPLIPNLFSTFDEDNFIGTIKDLVITFHNLNLQELKVSIYNQEIRKMKSLYETLNLLRDKYPLQQQLLLYIKSNLKKKSISVYNKQALQPEPKIEEFSKLYRPKLEKAVFDLEPVLATNYQYYAGNLNYFVQKFKDLVSHFNLFLKNSKLLDNLCHPQELYDRFNHRYIESKNQYEYSYSYEHDHWIDQVTNRVIFQFGNCIDLNSIYDILYKNIILKKNPFYIMKELITIDIIISEHSLGKINLIWQKLSETLNFVEVKRKAVNGNNFEYSCIANYAGILISLRLITSQHYYQKVQNTFIKKIERCVSNYPKLPQKSEMYSIPKEVVVNNILQEFHKNIVDESETSSNSDNLRGSYVNTKRDFKEHREMNSRENGSVHSKESQFINSKPALYINNALSENHNYLNGFDINLNPLKKSNPLLNRINTLEKSDKEEGNIPISTSKLNYKHEHNSIMKKKEIKPDLKIDALNEFWQSTSIDEDPVTSSKSFKDYGQETAFNNYKFKCQSLDAFTDYESTNNSDTKYIYYKNISSLNKKWDILNLLYVNKLNYKLLNTYSDIQISYNEFLPKFKKDALIHSIDNFQIYRKNIYSKFFDKFEYYKEKCLFTPEELKKLNVSKMNPDLIEILLNLISKHKLENTVFNQIIKIVTEDYIGLILNNSTQRFSYQIMQKLNHEHMRNFKLKDMYYLISYKDSNHSLQFIYNKILDWFPKYRFAIEFIFKLNCNYDYMAEVTLIDPKTPEPELNRLILNNWFVQTEDRLLVKESYAQYLPKYDRLFTHNCHYNNVENILTKYRDDWSSLAYTEVIDTRVNTKFVINLFEIFGNDLTITIGLILDAEDKYKSFTDERWFDSNLIGVRTADLCYNCNSVAEWGEFKDTDELSVEVKWSENVVQFYHNNRLIANGEIHHGIYRLGIFNFKKEIRLVLKEYKFYV